MGKRWQIVDQTGPSILVEGIFYIVLYWMNCGKYPSNMFKLCMLYAFFRVDVPKDDLTVAIHCQTNSTSSWWVSIWILHCGQCVWCQVLSRKGWEKDIHSPKYWIPLHKGPKWTDQMLNWDLQGNIWYWGEFPDCACHASKSINQFPMRGYAWNICSSGGDKTWQCTSQCAEGVQAKLTWTWKGLPGIDL